MQKYYIHIEFFVIKLYLYIIYVKSLYFCFEIKECTKKI